jgi:hypothetical protein
VCTQGYVQSNETVVGTFPASAVASETSAADEVLAAPVRRRVFSIASAEIIRSISVPAAERMIVDGKLSSMYQVEVFTNKRQGETSRRSVLPASRVMDGLCAHGV